MLVTKCEVYENDIVMKLNYETKENLREKNKQKLENEARQRTSKRGFSAISGEYKGKVQGGGKREKISKFSAKSARNMKFTVNNADMAYNSMITLTYHENYKSDGKETKYQLKKFLQWLKRNYQEIKYTWFLEFQERGAPHFHIITNLKFEKTKEFYYKKGKKVFKFSENAIQDIKNISEFWNKVTNESEQHLKCGTDIDEIRLGRAGIKSYVRKYSIKAEQKEVPENYTNVGRFWGTNCKPKPLEIIWLDEEETVNIKYKYAEKILAYFEKADMSYLEYSQNLILWNFKKEFTDELHPS